MNRRPALCPQLRAADLARDYGFTARYWIKLAVAGRIPSARQPSGPGGAWLFDPVSFADWWDKSEQRQAAPWRRSSSAAKHSGHAPSVKVATSESASRQRTE